MNNSKLDVNLFFKLHTSLLQYVNQRLKLLPKIKTPKKLQTSGIDNIVLVRDKLWKSSNFIDEFISENIYNFSEDDLKIILDWKKAIHGKFYIIKHLNKFSVFLTEKEPTKAYGVCSLHSPFDELFPKQMLPIYTEAILLPFQNHIIYDGILYPYPMIFGLHFRYDLNECYKESKEKFGVVDTIS